MVRKIAFFFVFFLCMEPVAQCRSADGTWFILKTKYMNLLHLKKEDLKAFDKRIKPVKNPGSFSNIYPSSSGPGFEKKLARKMDTLFEKVQLILDMRKPMNRVNIRIYPDKKSLHQAYFRMYKREKKLRAWYVFEFNTIYLSTDDLFSGMLAHEIAHAVIDHYLEVRPPRATAEILARYVDAHLNEKARIY